jgi:hypothetical protein
MEMEIQWKYKEIKRNLNSFDSFGYCNLFTRFSSACLGDEINYFFCLRNEI